MSLRDAGVVAGTVSTTLFIASYLPMLVKAARTRDLRSYSPGNLVIANVGNVVHTVYVVSLPAGPLWALHAFYLASSALMLLWWWRYRQHHAEPTAERSRRRQGPGEVETTAHPGLEVALVVEGLDVDPQPAVQLAPAHRHPAHVDVVDEPC